VEPIQLQCGGCGQMMAISPEHLGAQVQCPHCQAIVQTPPAGAGLGAAPPPAFNLGEHESIFGQPEPTDDLFGEGPAPRIEMPRDVTPPPAPNAPTVTMEPGPEHVSAGPPPFEQGGRPAGNVSAGPPPFMEQAASSQDQELAPFVPRKIDDRSMFVPIVLIFLVPYAIFTTAFIGYLLYSWPKEDNPLKTLPDPAGKGGPRLQVKHDLPLDQDMKTTLGRPIRVGAVEVTPLQVKHTSYGDLVLVFSAKNVSPDLVFNPISDDYLKYSAKSLDRGGPYTFLERVSKEKLRIYGGNLEWFKGAPGHEKTFDGEIGPGEEATIHLVSDVKYRNREVASFLNAAEKLVWRVQVRRGFVPVDGKQISATTVIGVEFTARDILKEPPAPDDDA
jgi:hypothetical protein